MTKVRRALVCAPGMAEFDREGGSRRTFHLLEFLRQAGWAVSFVAHNLPPGNERYIHLLQQMGVAVYAGPVSSRAGDEFIADLDSFVADADFDLAIMCFWYIAEYYQPYLKRHSPRTPVILDSIDLQFVREARRLFQKTNGAGGNDPLDQAYADQMRRELNVYAAAQAVMTVSAKETDLLNDLLGSAGHARLVPLMEDLAFSTRPFDERQGVLFIGNFRYEPNLDAARYFFNEVLPALPLEVRQTQPLYVVGNALNEEVAQLAQGWPNSRVVGWVPSLLPYLQTVRATVVPLRYGAGTKTKLIQALTVGTPSVSTRIGAEGLDLKDRREVLLADHPAEFAAALAELVQDRVLWERLHQEGHRHIIAIHGREVVQTSFNQLIETVMKDH